MRGYLAKLFHSGARPVSMPQPRPRAAQKPVEKTVEIPAAEEAHATKVAATQTSVPPPTAPEPAAQPHTEIAPDRYAARVDPVVARSSDEQAVEPRVETIPPPSPLRTEGAQRPAQVNDEPRTIVHEVERIVEVDKLVYQPKIPQLTVATEPGGRTEQRTAEKAEVKPREWLRPPLLAAEQKQTTKQAIPADPERTSAQTPELQKDQRTLPPLKFDVPEDEARDDLAFESLSRMKPLDLVGPDSERLTADPQPDAPGFRSDPARARGPASATPAQGLTIHKLEVEIVERPKPEPQPLPVVAPQAAAAPLWDWPDRRNWRQVR